MGQNQFTPTGIGSYDWAGNRAPAGGTHTGTSTVTMVDGVAYDVAHSAAEAIARTNQNLPVLPGTPRWVAFDVSGTAIPVILDADRIAYAQVIGPLRLGPNTILATRTILSSGSSLLPK